MHWLKCQKSMILFLARNCTKRGSKSIRLEKEVDILIDKIKEFWIEEDGIGVVEVIMILVVLIGLVVIFRNQLEALVNSIFGQIQSQSTKIY